MTKVRSSISPEEAIGSLQGAEERFFTATGLQLSWRTCAFLSAAEMSVRVSDRAPSPKRI